MGYSKTKPCGSLRLPTGLWTSHIHFPEAGNQGLEPCKSWFWRPARALRVAYEVEPEGIEPSFPDCQPGVRPLDDGPICQGMLPYTTQRSNPRIRANLGEQALLDEEVEPRISPAVELA